MNVRIVFVPAGGQAEVRDVPDDLPTWQALVGGHIEVVPFAPGVDLVCNDEGLGLGLPLNPLVSSLSDDLLIVGDAFLTGRPDAEGEATTLPDEVAERLVARLNGDRS